MKWKTLLDSFRKHHYSNKCTPSGSGTKKRQHMYANQMQFLLKTFPATNTVSHIMEPNCDDQDYSVDPLEPKNERPLKKPKTEDLNMIEFVNTQQDESETNETGLFFKSLLSAVKDFTEDETLELKGGVISLISNIRKARNNYSLHNASQTEGVTTIYSYSASNDTSTQVQSPSNAQERQMGNSYVQVHQIDTPLNVKLQPSASYSNSVSPSDPLI